MKRLPILLLALLLGCVEVRIRPTLGADLVPPFSMVETGTHYNFQSPDGPPSGVASGTPGQFGSLFSFGSVAAPTNSAAGLVTGSLVQNATRIGLPSGTDADGKAWHLIRARAGSLYDNRLVNYSFGAVIGVPPTKADGSAFAGNERAEDYWQAEPHWTNKVDGYHVDASYHWSPHAGVVFANQPGFATLRWKRKQPTIPAPTTGLENYANEDGSYFQLFTSRFLVSGTAIKPPRAMYWTEGTFAATGVKVSVPQGLVTDLRFAHYTGFPAFVDPSQGTPTSTGTISNSIYLDQNLIRAANVQGRIFMELLGAPVGGAGGTVRRHLGFEILDVSSQPAPQTIVSELGERLTVPGTSENVPGEDEYWPVPQTALATASYFLSENAAGSDHARLYAIRESVAPNHPKVWWLEEGIGGLRWPRVYAEYQQIWPTDPARYSHYLRPTVADVAEARETAVPLPAENAPAILFQDGEDDGAERRAQLTSTFGFFTYLTADFPVHRTLLQFTAGSSVRFERVFSWLDGAVKGSTPAAAYEGIGAPGWITGWNATLGRFEVPEFAGAPRLVEATAEVGRRIVDPDGETGDATPGSHVAGHVRWNQGDALLPSAYLDPLLVGFDEASRGAIIPVNVLPGSGTLEVWWFRSTHPDANLGFQPIRWPAVIGVYELTWPADAREIVLASDDGSGPLGSLEAKGRIYFQNDQELPGFNPNEEHALMSGGQVYALRDDLNVVDDSGDVPFSSEPFVLLEYEAADGRPDMTPFKVVREKGDETFRYSRKAGTVLQPPMPLPLLGVPIGATPPGGTASSLNVEVGPAEVATANLPAGLGTLTTAGETHFRARAVLALQQDAGTPGEPHWFYPTNILAEARQLRGAVSATHPLTPVSAVQSGNSPTRVTYRIGTGSLSGWETGAAVLAVRADTGSSWLTEIASKTATEVVLRFSQGFADGMLAMTDLVLIDPAPPDFTGARLANEPLPAGVSDVTLREFQASFTLHDRKGNVWIYRGPHVEGGGGGFQMQFHYKTLDGFFFPSRSLADQPPVGTLTPYLRERTDDGLGYLGDPVFADADLDGTGDGQAFAVTYEPRWPDTAPVLQMAETLTLPKRGLPAVRGQTSLEIVYQQSQVGSPDTLSVELHDPTREKVFNLKAPDAAAGLRKIPDSVKTESLRGKTYFPNLPPHLAQRFFFDPNRGAHGALVFRGEFVDEAVGEKYLLLNVIGAADAAALEALCDAGDPEKDEWNEVIREGLKTALETFEEDLGKPGTYVPGTSVVVGPDALSRITDDDIAVDSYALTATGPGLGYVTLIAGNGRAFTPKEEPVSVQILKVVRTLHPGEVKIILPQNPLSEQVTLQQTVDLAGQSSDFNFQWKIAAPVDGLPPVVYQNERRLLLGDGAWDHVPFPDVDDLPATLASTPAERVRRDVDGFVIPLQSIPFDDVTGGLQPFFGGLPGRVRLGLPADWDGRLVPGNKLVLRDQQNREAIATVQADNIEDAILDAGLGAEERSLPRVSVAPDSPDAESPPEVAELLRVYEASTANQPQSAVFRQFTTAATQPYTGVFLSLDLAPSLGAEVYLNGSLVAVANRGATDTVTISPPGGLFPLGRVYRVAPELLSAGSPDAAEQQRTNTVVVQFFSSALPDVPQTFNLRIEAFVSTDHTSEGWLPLEPEKFVDGVRAVLGGTADVRSLADNYLIMRYQAKNAGHASFVDQDGDLQNDVWSAWTTPQLAEGWIKRVLAGINPFNQRVTDLFNNRVNTDVSLLTQAGPRWEGDVALSLDTINDSGLIEIYETVLRRGRMLSIDGGIDYGPANDALLLATGYLNDLYGFLGNEAWADAANPTIGIGTKDRTYGDVATALFAFKGQMPSLLEEELALLRGRDDFLQPGVETPPVYNRLFWNYTRGIDAGEVIYALNYNIQEDPGQDPDGVVNAEDAHHLYPQGHGDAYGHYLTALKGYYGLLLDTDFDWVPRTEAVTILGKPVQVDYLDERKFAASAAALARTGRQIFDLTWRRDYQPGIDSGWDWLEPTRSNSRRQQPSTRYWGLDHWAARTATGTYLNWVVGNAILPDVDPDPAHEGIQKIDRTTVPELVELPTIMADLQTSLENAEGHLTPLGLPEGALAFDINPNQIVGGQNTTHFEQVYGRAIGALNNALTAFDDAKDVTRLMRSEEDSLADFRAQVEQQELAYAHALIELYGSPYPDDIGPGRTYPTGFSGPDLIHFEYVDVAELNTPLFATDVPAEVRIDVQLFTDDYMARLFASPDWIVPTDSSGGGSEDDDDREYREWDPGKGEGHFVSYTLPDHGFHAKPSQWKSRRASPGQIQQAISEIIRTQNWAGSAFADMDWAKWDLDKAIQLFYAGESLYQRQRDHLKDTLEEKSGLSAALFAAEVLIKGYESITEDIEWTTNVSQTALPRSAIVGVAAGGDLTSAARMAILASGYAITTGFDSAAFLTYLATRSLEFAQEQNEIFDEYNHSQPWERQFEKEQAVVEIGAKLSTLQGLIFPLNYRLQELDDARRQYQALVARGNRIQEEREVYRKRASAVIQGYRTRDAAFRIFRNEKLERYKTLFDLAARYAFLAAQAYDYETGLLGTPDGKSFIRRIVGARALGVVKAGEPQYAGSNTGDPGLSSALAEMKADWDVLKGRLGFNNPDAYGTTVSLRTENYRILAGADGATNWKDVLNQGRMEDLRADPDVRRYCMQIGAEGDLPVPGIVLTFGTTIAEGYNLFGRPVAGGDHGFSPTTFATKIFGVGVAFEGYHGMDDPTPTSVVVGAAGAAPAAAPWSGFLDPLALSATPYIYLIPVGVDSMRTPPLGDVSAVRNWNVDDVTIPLPFNLGGSEYSAGKPFQSADSLMEPLFSTRKHQAFRPVSTAQAFSRELYGSNGQLQPSQYTNRRLIGRSAWNSKWKLVIPGRTLLHDARQGLEVFVDTVTDVKLHLVTYSYSGN